jgi:acetyl esterase/lipase
MRTARSFTTLAALRFDDSSRPDFVASIYGVHPLEEMVVPPDAPPMFLAYALDDPFMSGGTVFDPLLVVKAWRDAGVPVELHAYETGGHGFHTEIQGTTSDGWTSAFARWMKARKFLPE